ncbi:unnamed protein product [Cylicocyclus nassatus]|uniref:Uncharacterized protein n=1 Tax=Cylicocyclus nassatus TaxID=53992 RepID=A0AA36GE84_CYLNA|nr:unnamed protein product [Cylicocyclus nassatus]
MQQDHNEQQVGGHCPETYGTKQLGASMNVGEQHPLRETFVMDYKLTFECPWRDAKSSPSYSTIFSYTATCAVVHTFSNKVDVLDTANYAVEERSIRVASRLIQLCDNFDKELFHVFFQSF